MYLPNLFIDLLVACRLLLQYVSFQKICEVYFLACLSYKHFYYLISHNQSNICFMCAFGIISREGCWDKLKLCMFACCEVSMNLLCRGSSRAHTIVKCIDGLEYACDNLLTVIPLNTMYFSSTSNPRSKATNDSL